MRAQVKSLSRLSRPRRCAALLAALMGASLAPRVAFAQSGGASDAACSSTLDGHVVGADSHEPIAGATVRMGGEAVALTDGNGHFGIKGVCGGDVVLTVERADYGSTMTTISLKEGATRVVELSLERSLVGGEIIAVEGEDIIPVDMHSTSVLTGEDLERTRGRSFADALDEVPGVAQLRSATGLAKPIIRGQFGRRLLLLVDGARHRSQNWGLDHAPEIDPFVADRLTVVRGAAGVRYGPDAIGGAVLVEPPELPTQPGESGEAHLIGLLARGGAVAGRLQSASRRWPGLSWRASGTVKRLASAHTPDYPLDNTASLEWSLGAAGGYRRGESEVTLSARHYQSRAGVCSCLSVESADDFFAQLDRRRPKSSELYRHSLGYDRPFQAVSHETVLARAEHPLEDIGTLSGSYNLQYDHREEFDTVRTATGPQFDFRLTTHDAEARLEHKPLHLTNHLHLRGSAGVVGMGQVHDYRGLPLIPDYRALGGGLYAIERLLGHDFEVEAGVRYDALHRRASFLRRDFLRMVRSEQIALDACSDPEADFVSCRSTFHTFAASLGGLYQITRPWALKLSLSTASRPPNPDEQYLNGTSPTSPVLGLGKPDLGAETTYSASLSSNYDAGWIAAEASAYANRISDYIYFSAAIDESGEPIFDVLVRGTFPRFVTRPVNALFYGFDGGLVFRPISGLEFGGQVSVVRARNTTDDSFLAFVPPERLRGSVTYAARENDESFGGFATLAGTYVGRQDRFDIRADLAPPPDAYFLLEAELGVDFRVDEGKAKLAVHATNLLDTRYRDYTSLTRYFADQPGLQVMVRLSVHGNWGVD